MFRSASSCRASIFWPAPKDTKNAPLNFGSTSVAISNTVVDEKQYFCTDDAVFLQRATYEAPKAVGACLPHPQLSISVETFCCHAPSLSSADAVMPPKGGSFGYSIPTRFAQINGGRSRPRQEGESAEVESRKRELKISQIFEWISFRFSAKKSSKSRRSMSSASRSVLLTKPKYSVPTRSADSRGGLFSASATFS